MRVGYSVSAQLWPSSYSILPLTQGNAIVTPEIQEGIANMSQAAIKYAPEWKGPISADQSVTMVLDVVGHATIENNGGRVVSHLGTKRWL